MEHSTGKLQMKESYHTDMKKPRRDVGAEVASRIKRVVDKVTLRERLTGFNSLKDYHRASTEPTQFHTLGQTSSEYKERPGLCCSSLSLRFQFDGWLRGTLRKALDHSS